MSETMAFNPVVTIAKELNLSAARVNAVAGLLAEGNTIPFIARYRKEVTGDLDEVQIRAIEERKGYLEELEKRRDAILGSIEEQGKLTDGLRAKIAKALTKATLEDLYLPYKPKRRTRATIAREKGLEPLGQRILDQPVEGDPRAEARAFVDAEKGVGDVDAALAGARDIAAEAAAENAEVNALVRDHFARLGLLLSESVPEKAGQGAKFKDYFDFREPVASIPSHRFLAMRRGEREGVLRTNLQVEAEELVAGILAKVGHAPGSPFAGELELAVGDGYKRLIAPRVENDVRVDLKMRSDHEAVAVFARNLRSILMDSPFGSRTVIGVDPGLRTGCKCAAVAHTGKFIGNMTFNLVRGDKGLSAAARDFAAFVRVQKPEAIAVGNGTGGREAEKFIRKVLAEVGLDGVIVVQVSESGASVYSASELAGSEFPDLDLTVRGAISIARRLQDPLAELVKIDPKSLGVGQYQHDVYQPLLVRNLGEVVESCVNEVGVDLNTASAPLLAQVAGIGPGLASAIVARREESGAFSRRKQLLEVAGLGPRTFEQAAGFLRIRDGEVSLDASAVHPERYALVERMAADLEVTLDALVGDGALADGIDIGRYVGDGVGEPTLRDIVEELKKPGRDPRSSFEPPAFRDDVNELDDLEQGMELEGVVTNVTAFGAFVDVGVHQDGLVHISQLADRYVKDPAEVVKAGDRIKVCVLDVDLERRRISLSAKKGGPKKGGPPKKGDPKKGSARKTAGRPGDTVPGKPDKFSNSPFAALLKK
ncbi:Tex family protein [Thermodesulfobacteriota bacterium]